MPTYDYVCDACDHKFEQFQSMKDDALTKCPKCKKKTAFEMDGIACRFRCPFANGGRMVGDFIGVPPRWFRPL